MSKIEAIDLAEYGLDNMLYDADGDGNYETTALQLLIYAHEELYGGDWGDVNFDALPGSSYFKGGIFGLTENLVYFHNGDFPVDESQQSDFMTVGATSDRIVLEAGDFLDVASFSCFSFLWDQLGGFHLFADENNNYTHDYTADAGEALDIKLKHSFCDLMLLYLGFCGFYLLAGSMVSAFGFRFFPSIRYIGLNPVSLSFQFVYLILCLMPVVLNWAEERKWKAIHSKI